MTKRIIIFFAFMMASLAVSARENFLAEMLKKGQHFEELWQPDSALFYLRKISDAYSPSMSYQQKKICLEAILGCCDANMNKGNYLQALDDLMLAEEIRRTDGIDTGWIDLYNAIFYIVLSSQTEQIDHMKMAKTYARRAFHKAITCKDMQLLYRSFGNLTLATIGTGDTVQIKRELSILHNWKSPKDWRVKESLHYYGIIRSMLISDWKHIKAYCDSSLMLIPHESKNLRYLNLIKNSRSIATGMLEGPEAGLREHRDVMEATYRYNWPDLRLSALKGVIITLKESKDRKHRLLLDSLEAHQIKLRDSLRSFDIAGGLAGLEYSRERRILLQNAMHANIRSRIIMWVCIFIGFLALVLTVFLIILRNKNRKLRDRTALLRDRIREIYSSPENTRHTLNLETLQKTPKTEKYKGSNLTDADKQQIRLSIDSIINSDELFSSEFSLNTLAERVGRHPNAVSQVINEQYAMNFPSLVNRKRILEACRRMDSKQYENWSVEGIAESVGFSSRSAFSTNFKKVTGMGIREYRQNR